MRRVALLLLLGLLSVMAWAGQAYAPDRILVRYTAEYNLKWKANSDDYRLRGRPSYGRVLGLMAPGQAIRASIEKEIPELDMRVLRLPKNMKVADAIAKYGAQSHVLYAEPVYLDKYVRDPNDPRYGQQYHFANIRAPQAWDLTTGDPGTVISILDSGVDIEHEDLAAQLVAGYDFVDNDTNPDDTIVGHGTFCAGLAGASTNNSLGIAGVGWSCKIMPIRAGDAAGIYVDAQIQGLMFSKDNGASVISMSFGGPGVSQARYDALRSCYDAGIILVAAAGNDNSNSLFYPAGHGDVVISVGATDSSDQKASFSNYGDWVHVAAPGVEVTSTTMGGGYGPSSGTSFSCPITAGVLGLMRSFAPMTVTNTQIRNSLQNTCDDVGNWVVHGRINAFRALNDLPIYAQTSVAPDSVTVMDGSPVPGNSLAKLLAVDGQYYSLKGMKTASSGAMATFFVEFPIANPGSVAETHLQVASRGVTTSTQMLFVYNWVSQDYEYVDAGRFTSNSTNQSVQITDSLGSYVSSSGKLRVAIRAIEPQGQNQTVTWDWDRLSLDVSTRAN